MSNECSIARCYGVNWIMVSGILPWNPCKFILMLVQTDGWDVKCSFDLWTLNVVCVRVDVALVLGMFVALQSVRLNRTASFEYIQLVNYLIGFLALHSLLFFLVQIFSYLANISLRWTCSVQPMRELYYFVIYTHTLTIHWNFFQMEYTRFKCRFILGVMVRCQPKSALHRPMWIICLREICFWLFLCEPLFCFNAINHFGQSICTHQSHISLPFPVPLASTQLSRTLDSPNAFWALWLTGKLTPVFCILVYAKARTKAIKHQTATRGVAWCRVAADTQ